MQIFEIRFIHSVKGSDALAGALMFLTAGSQLKPLSHKGGKDS